eukprot:sb/3474482/
MEMRLSTERTAGSVNVGTAVWRVARRTVVLSRMPLAALLETERSCRVWDDDKWDDDKWDDDKWDDDKWDDDKHSNENSTDWDWDWDWENENSTDWDWENSTDWDDGEDWEEDEEEMRKDGTSHPCQGVLHGRTRRGS